MTILMWHTASVVRKRRYKHDPDSDPEYIARVKGLAVKAYKRSVLQERLREC